MMATFGKGKKIKDAILGKTAKGKATCAIAASIVGGTAAGVAGGLAIRLLKKKRDISVANSVGADVYANERKKNQPHNAARSKAQEAAQDFMSNKGHISKRDLIKRTTTYSASRDNAEFQKHKRKKVNFL